MSTQNNGKYKGIDSSEYQKIINSPGTMVSSPLRVKSDTGFAVNASEINWKGYNLDDNFTYTGDLISYIQSSYSYLLEELDKKATESEDIWDNRNIVTQILIYKRADETPNALNYGPDSDYNYDESTNTNTFPQSISPWSINIPESGGTHLYMSTCFKVTESDGTFIGYCGPCASPGKIGGGKGDFKSTVFARTSQDLSSYSGANIQGGNYDNPVPNNTIYNNETIVWSDGIPKVVAGETAHPIWATSKTFSFYGNNSEWSDPALMADTPFYDVEFSYEDIDPTNSSHNPTNKPQWWVDPTTSHYKDYTEENQHQYTGDFSEMIWRAERTRPTILDQWSSWVITKIKGEDGTKGKPSPYYQTRYLTYNGTSLPNNAILTTANCGINPAADPITVNSSYNWYLTIHDGIGNVFQTSRKVDWAESQLGLGDWYEVWYDNSSWSTPFMLNGLPGESQPIHPCLMYTWYEHYDNGTHYPSYITTSNGPNPQNMSIWNESPNNPTPPNIYLWMIQGEYKLGNNNQRDYQPIDNNGHFWTNPICLSGKDGNPGADGDDIEFIYLCPESKNPTSFGSGAGQRQSPSTWYTADPNKHNVAYTGSGEYNYSTSYENDFLGPEGQGWTDNPTGVDENHKYEYAAYRRTSKNSNGKTYWNEFSTPFAWSIYGENGIDGDGVEYIYYRSGSSTPPSVNDSLAYPPSWINTSSINSHFQTDDFPCISELAGGTWNPAISTGWHNNCYMFHGWTDEPQGVTANEDEKYEFVSVRKKKLDATGTKKEWKAFSPPTLWSNYAKDGLAINLVLETDNDNVTVGIDEHSIVNHDYTDEAEIVFKYNGNTVDKSYYSLSLNLTSQHNYYTKSGNNIKYSDGTINNYTIISLNTNTNTISATIPKNMNMAVINSKLSIQIVATLTQDYETIESGTTFSRAFKVTGVELSAEDIYKLIISNTTPVRDTRNEGYEVLKLKLKSYTSNDPNTGILSSYEAALAKKYFIICKGENSNLTSNEVNNLPSQEKAAYNTYGSDGIIITNFDNIELNKYYNKHVFTLYYNKNLSGNPTTNNISSSLFVDEEEVTCVFNGNNGVDSKGEEYIYLLTDNYNFFDDILNNDSISSKIKNYYSPKTWRNNINYKDGDQISYYQHDDYPYITENNYFTSGITSYSKSIKYDSNSSHTYYGTGSVDTENDLVIGYWTDNPQGISEDYKYEFRCLRRYNTSEEYGSRWQAFEEPVIWANWGHSGEDGDGIQYIYYLCDNKNQTFSGNTNPTTWYNNFSDYQEGNHDGEYYAYGWTDNPQQLTSSNKYQFVSERKFKYNSNKQKKEWFPYSTPTLWSNYNNATGINGITIDFDNPSMQIAVNSTSYIKDNQSVTTYLNIYDGQTKISPSKYILSIDNSTPNAFKTIYNNSKEFGYTLYKNSSIAYYTWKIGDIDDGNGNGSTENDGIITPLESQYYNDLKLGDQSSIVFNISYNNNNYTKRVHLVPIQYGKDGEDAETWELYCPHSTITGNNNGIISNGFDPDQIEYKIKHIKGNSTIEILTLSEANTKISNSGRLDLYYLYQFKESSQNAPETSIYGQENSTSSGSGIYSPSGEAIDIRGENDPNFALDPEEVRGDNEIVIKVNQIDLRDENDDQLSNVEQTILNIINETSVENDETGWKDILDNSSITYDNNSISSVIESLNDYTRNYILTHEESDIVNNIINTISTVASNLGKLDEMTGEFILDSNISYIYVADKESSPQLITREEAIAQYQASKEPQESEGPGDISDPSQPFIPIDDGSDIYSPVRPRNLMSVSPKGNTNNWNQSLDGTIDIVSFSSVLNHIQVKLEYVPNSGSAELWDEDTIEVLYTPQNGTQGKQGFTGPVVRMRGEFGEYKNVIAWYDDSNVPHYQNKLFYLTGSYNTNYNGNSILYKDIVSYSFTKNGVKYTKFYTPKQPSGTSNYFSVSNSPTIYEPFGGCLGAGFLSCYNNNALTKYPASPSGVTNSNWIEAETFEFIATKLLYADQALINQLSTHDLIVTNSNGYPVAGVTSGRAAMTDSNGNPINSPLQENLGSAWSGNSPVGNYNDDPVRIFAGPIKNGNSYSLTNAPFRVTESGVAYMTKARISGDAIIEGDITADTLKLQQTISDYNGSFTYFDSQTSEFYLPNLEKNTTQMYFVLCRNGNTNNYFIKLPYYSPTQDRFQYSENSRITVKYDRKFKPEKNTLYQLVGTYVSTENYPTWSVIETPLAPIDSGGTEYRYIDITDDVTLFGYRCDTVTNGNDSVTTASIAPYDPWTSISGHNISWGPIMKADNTNKEIILEFYTFINPDMYEVDEYDDPNAVYALGDLGTQIWILNGSN